MINVRVPSEKVGMLTVVKGVIDGKILANSKPFLIEFKYYD